MNTSKINDILIVLATYIGINQIETVLGIIILSFQVILIIYKAIRKVYNLIKGKQYNQIEDTIKDTIESLEDLKKDNSNE